MKEIEVSFSASICLEGMDINALEERLLALRQQAFQSILIEVLERMEANVLAAERLCPYCGSLMRPNGTNARRLQTLLGEITFKRARLRCAGCGKESSPLDDVLGLAPRDKCTLGVRERALWAATEVSYEKAESFLAKFTSLAVSHGSIHRMAVEEGLRLLAIDTQEREAVLADGRRVPEPAVGPDRVYVQVDSTGVHRRDTHHPMDCKVGIIFSKKALVSKNRIALIDKYAYASMENAEQFGEHFMLECAKRGVFKASEVIFVSDGAHWIKHLQKQHLPKAVYVLDPWHLEKSLRETLGIEADRQVDHLMNLAWQGKPQQLLDRLTRRARHLKDREKASQIFELCQYIANNREGIENLTNLAAAGSGPVEKQIDTLVCRRLKQRGMSWYKPTSHALLRLRLLKLNNQWDKYWAERTGTNTAALTHFH